MIKLLRIPFPTEQFFQVFEKYNQTVFPMQFALILAAIAAVTLATNPKPFANKIISGLLGFLWLWAGVAYHLIFFTKISPPAYFFGASFVFQGLLFLYEGVLRNRLSFLASRRFHGIIGAILIVYALAIYPLIGYALGRTFPTSPTFGVPCPTTIFTFGLLLWTDKRFPLSLLIVPILWSIVGTSAALSFGIKEDFGLLVAGTIGTASIIWRNLTPKMEFNMESETKLTLIKIIHTAIWVFFNFVIFYMLYAAIANKLDLWLWIGYGFVSLEGVILLTFRFVCPLSMMARKYSNSTKDNFAIYLPNWLSKYTFLIYTTICTIVLIITIYQTLN